LHSEFDKDFGWPIYRHWVAVLAGNRFFREEVKELGKDLQHVRLEITEIKSNIASVKDNLT